MALLFMDGFGSGPADQKWDVSSNVESYLSGGTARSSGGRYGRQYNTSVFKTVPAANKIIFGAGIHPISNARFSWSFYGDTGATAHITVVKSTAATMQIRRGDVNGTLLATSTQLAPTAMWTYVEISVTISDTVGEVHVRLNGSSTDAVSFTGDTKNGGTATTIDRVNFASLDNTFQYIADAYILDDTGPAPNNAFLGDVTVRTLSPNGNGNSSQLVGSDSNSTDNYLLVDELPFSGADYTGSATTNNKDTYTLADLPAYSSTVFGVQVNASMLKSDAGAGSARTVIRTGSTDYGGTTRALSTSATQYNQLYEQNPNTSSAWTVSDVNGLEAGMEVM